MLHLPFSRVEVDFFALLFLLHASELSYLHELNACDEDNDEDVDYLTSLILDVRTCTLRCGNNS